MSKSSKPTLSPDRGFHTTLSTELNLVKPTQANCSLHQLLKLPPRVFVDPYELALRGQAFQISGSSNLELPVTAMDSSGSFVLFELLNIAKNGPVHVEIPLHVRYGVPDGPELTDIQWPFSFWSCPSTGLRYHRDHRIPPSFESRFHNTLLERVQYVGGPSISTIRAPVGTLSDLFMVELGTTLAILFVFSYLLYTSYYTSMRISARRRTS